MMVACHSNKEMIMKTARYFLFLVLFLGPLSLHSEDGIFDILFGHDESEASLSQNEITRALKEALLDGTQNVVGRLGSYGGFLNDDAVRIPLPPNLAKVDALLQQVGLGELSADLKQRINHAAEAAIPKAGELFMDTIQRMSLDDARAILDGPDDAATQTLRRRMSQPLAAAMRPIVQASLADSGAVKVFDGLVKQYNRLPLVKPISGDLNQHVVNTAMDGVFYYLARQEAAIRKDPLKQTSKLLKKVFGSVLERHGEPAAG